MIDAASIELLNTGLLGNIAKSKPVARKTTVMARSWRSDDPINSARWTIGPLLSGNDRYFVGDAGKPDETPGETSWCCGASVPSVQDFGPHPWGMTDIAKAQ